VAVVPVPVAIGAAHDHDAAAAQRIDHQLYVEPRVFYAEDHVVEVNQQRDFGACEPLCSFQVVLTLTQWCVGSGGAVARSPWGRKEVRSSKCAPGRRWNELPKGRPVFL